METIFKVVDENIWVTEYENNCSIVQAEYAQTENDIDIFGASTLWRRVEWVFKQRYLDFEKNLKDFGNPLCGIDIVRYTFCLEKGDDKISLKLFKTIKIRKPGVFWFKRSSDVSFITYNTKTKNMYFGQIIGHNKKKRTRRKVICNYFGNLANNIYGTLIDVCKRPEYPEYPAEKSITIEVVNKIFGEFYNLIGLKSQKSYFDLSSDLYKKYLTDRNFKIPNNFLIYKNAGNKPPIRLFKKNQYRLVETYMQHYGLRGDKIRKILHNIDSVDFFGIQKLVNIFSIDFLLQRPDDELKILFRKDVHYLSKENLNDFKESVSKKEFANFYLTYFDFIKNENGTHSLDDHIKFYLKIKKHEKVRWKSVDIKSFRLEHSEYTDKYDYYTRGHYDREYDENFVNYIQKPFVINGIIYSPKLLQKNSEYIEESAHQSNCVKTYNGNIASIIISLRNDKNERLTMQFTPKKFPDGKVLWKNSQTRARFNANPEEEWNEAIYDLEEKLRTITNFTLPKVWFINYNSRTPVNLTWGLKGDITSINNINIEGIIHNGIPEPF